MRKFFKRLFARNIVIVRIHNLVGDIKVYDLSNEELEIIKKKITGAIEGVKEDCKII